MDSFLGDYYGQRCRGGWKSGDVFNDYLDLLDGVACDESKLNWQLNNDATTKEFESWERHGNLIGDYVLDNDFLVTKLCITCDDFPYPLVLSENKFQHMFNHFDMTSNSVIDFMPNSMLHDHLFMPIVACWRP
jgi:hypothetical protein